ncbi:hypothetical protein [Teredinibacter turnerae]|uniref:hypothetical protein n=1 Tax=Teredinibacter turnerae TaxID=2426 RepID=UPI0003788B51|nr:hypothetical protein [Teredinibacter turnerae]
MKIRGFDDVVADEVDLLVSAMLESMPPAEVRSLLANFRALRSGCAPVMPLEPEIPRPQAELTS